MRALVILPNDGQHMDLVSAWYDVLRGDGDAVLIQNIQNTINWQQRQVKLTQGFLNYLKNEGLIVHVSSQKNLTKAGAHGIFLVCILRSPGFM